MEARDKCMFTNIIKKNLFFIYIFFNLKNKNKNIGTTLKKGKTHFILISVKSSYFYSTYQL